MSIITIDYNTLLMVVVGLFALSGFLRGWWREGITTVFLILLTILLTQPTLTETIIQFLNTVIQAVWNFISGAVGTVSGAEVSAAETTPPIVLDPANRSLYIVILIVILLVAYFTSNITLGGRTISAGARILGGILGAVNGFLVVNLVKEFIVGSLVPETGVSATAAAPATLSVSIADVPPESVFTSTPLLLVIGFGLLVLALVLGNRISRSGTRAPWGYK